MNIIDITDSNRNIIAPKWLAMAETVHRQLRPQIPAEYAARMAEIFVGGAEMAVAVEGEELFGLTVFRMMERTFTGRELYFDDLVADDTKRSSGVGHALVAHVEALAKARGAAVVTLDSGTQRQQAHRFYFREGFTISSFHFSKTVK